MPEIDNASRAERLAHHRAQGLWREPPVFTHSDGRFLYADNQQWLDFASNDYLGLAHHPQVIEAWQQQARWGVGARASAYVTGQGTAHQQLCAQLQALTGKEGVLLFNSGFAANQGLLETLAGANDVLLQDKLNHASLLDGGLHSAATQRRFRHNDMTSLEQQLQAHTPAAQHSWVVTEGVFSMDGDQPPLAELCRLAQAHHSGVILDDAHGIGVVGEQGLGSLALPDITAQHIDVYVVTFGKAIGVAGAAVCADSTLIQYLQQFCRHAIYTTALPAAQAAAVNQAFQILRNDSQYHQQLMANIAQFRTLAQHYGLPIMGSQSAIQPVFIGDNKRVMMIAEALRQRGFWVGAIRPPTVPKGQARLRITLSASHQPADILALASTLAAFWE